jgi:hypothetical protein
MHTKSGRRRNRPPFCCAALLFETAGDRLNFGIKRQYLNEIKSMSGFNRKAGFADKFVLRTNGGFYALYGRGMRDIINHAVRRKRVCPQKHRIRKTGKRI